MIRHRLLLADGCVLMEFDHNGMLPDRFEQRDRRHSYRMRYIGTDDGVRVYIADQF